MQLVRITHFRPRLIPHPLDRRRVERSQVIRRGRFECPPSVHRLRTALLQGSIIQERVRLCVQNLVGKRRGLRQVASKASVALGYLSEVERGQKEASSEILASVAEALDVPISMIMREVGDRISVLEGIQVFPDVVPDDLVASIEPQLTLR